MTDTPVNLDKHRRADSQIAVDLRRYETRTCCPDNLSRASARDDALQSQLLAGPADGWRDIARKASFLPDRSAATSEAQGMCLQILIKRALCDMYV